MPGGFHVLVGGVLFVLICGGLIFSTHPRKAAGLQ